MNPCPHTSGMIKFTLTAFAALVSALPALEASSEEASQGPNFVFILADDLGYGELGCYGQKKIQTPHLDQLALQGLRFTQHYSGNAVCAPSRCVLMTGKHPGHAEIRSNLSTPPEGQSPISSSEVTLAELLQARGYVTGAFGKWGLGGPESCGAPLVQGFERFFGYNCQAHAHSYYPSYLWSDAERISLGNQPEVPGHAGLPTGADPKDPRSYDRFKGQDYAPDRIHQQALAFLEKNRERPFFLYYPCILPHVALHVPDEDLEPYLAQGWQDPPFTAARGGYTPHFTPRAAYAAMISRLDRYVGELLKKLDELNLAQNTIVIFSSDNGTTHLEEEVDYTFFESVGELRGLKGSLYEGGIRVPTIVRWPGHTPAGTTTDYVSGFEDWLPTLLDVVGATDQLPAGVDGVSLKPTLLGQTQTERALLYREFPGYGGQQSIRVGSWKAVRQNMNRGNLRIELYHLKEDPSERKDVAAKHPELVQQLARTMSQQHTPSKLFPIPVLDRP
jgi:arylsulfatase A